MLILMRFLYWPACLMGCVLLTEVLFSALYVHGWVAPPDSVMIFEDSGKTVHFDPVLGFRYTTVSSRAARLTLGEVEFLTTLQGNNLGFQERDPVYPAHSGNAYRVAVLGDSFSAAEHLALNWPDKLERLPPGRTPLELPNFSVSGAGLANWWNIVHGLLDRDNFQFDGILFAVFEGDLHRTFSVADHRHTQRHRFGRTPSWDPQSWPRTLAEAQPLLQDLRGYILDPRRFEQALSGDWHPELPRPWGAHGWRMLQRYFTEKPTAAPMPAPPSANLEIFTEGQMDLIADIRDYLQRRGLACMVVRIPSREGLLAGSPSAPDAEAFARLLGARYLDGAAAFAALGGDDIRSHWLPHDGHWNQLGSDRFAAFLRPHLQAWIGPR